MRIFTCYVLTAFKRSSHGFQKGEPGARKERGKLFSVWGHYLVFQGKTFSKKRSLS